MFFPSRKVFLGALRIFICEWTDIRNFVNVFGLVRLLIMAVTS